MTALGTDECSVKVSNHRSKLITQNAVRTTKNLLGHMPPYAGVLTPSPKWAVKTRVANVRRCPAQ